MTKRGKAKVALHVCSAASRYGGSARPAEGVALLLLCGSVILSSVCHLVGYVGGLGRRNTFFTYINGHCFFAFCHSAFHRNTLYFQIVGKTCECLHLTSIWATAPAPKRMELCICTCVKLHTRVSQMGAVVP